jgi:peptidoglycan/LPS O-acetylase OafA/YrhL
VAVVLVVLYHADVPRVTGGYVGVDVFFVISGFVITGVLLRERASTGRTSILAFYGRRCRRIIPAAALVILVSVLLSYHLLGFVTAGSVAVDGRWAAVFLSNFHFEQVGTNYLSSFRPPSPLQNYWSLSVEEQFYAVFPMLFLLVARYGRRLSFRARLAIGLTVVIMGSFSLSVIQTATNQNAAYFSPFTRAWELALGALIAVGTRWLVTIPEIGATAMTWFGIGMILVAAFTLNAQSDYPGWLVAAPVLGAGLVIAGGAAGHRFGVEVLLRLFAFRWLGRRSYSLYLWHWPILILAAESQGQTSLPAPQSLLWVAVALVVSVVTYALFENPIRHARLWSRNRWASIGLGLGLTALTVGVLTIQIDLNGGADTAAETAATSTNNSTPASLATVRHLVLAAAHIRTPPANLTPSLGEAYFDFGIPSSWQGCDPAEGATNVPACTFGDPQGSHTVVLYGDSHALMWAQAINDVAIRAKWKFVLLAKPDCPFILLHCANPLGFGVPGGEWSACDQWHQNAIRRIDRLDPNMLIVTQEYNLGPGGRQYTAGQWQRALEDTLNLVSPPGTTKVVLGNIPALPESGPNCVARHLDDVQKCSGPPTTRLSPYNRAERIAAAATGARYVDVTTWFCSKTCSPIIGRYDVYVDQLHITNTYARFLEGVVGDALQLPVLQGLPPPVQFLDCAILVPATRSTVSGTTSLEAKAPADVNVTRVEFRISGGPVHDALIGIGKPTLDGWLAGWDTTSVANGTYAVQAFAYDAAGKMARSKAVTVFVDN